MRYANIVIAANAVDQLVVDFAVNSGSLPTNPAWTPVLYGYWLSSNDPSFDWTLFYSDAAAEGDPEDIPVEDSLADIPTTVVNPTASSGPVVNRSMVCPDGKFVPRGASLPMDLRVSATGNTATTRIRVAWDWKRVAAT